MFTLLFLSGNLSITLYILQITGSDKISADEINMVVGWANVFCIMTFLIFGTIVGLLIMKWQQSRKKENGDDAAPIQTNNQNVIDTDKLHINIDLNINTADIAKMKKEQLYILNKLIDKLIDKQETKKDKDGKKNNK